MSCRLLRPLVLGAVLLASPVAAFAQSTPPAPRVTPEDVVAAMDADDYGTARTLAEQYLERTPEHPLMLYNLACCLAQLGEIEDATSTLFRAVRAGFREFDHLRRDPDLEPLHGETMYQSILEAADRLERERADTALERWRTEFDDPRYRFEIDEARRIAFVSALDATAHDEMRARLEAHADLLRTTLFGDPPSYYVLVAIPTPQDADTFFNGDRSIGGMYEHARRQLITRDIGSSLMHEFVHALHYGHMERMGLRDAHPIWVIEGLATLYETYDVTADGTVRFEANERTNLAIRLARRNRLTSWSTLFAMRSEPFMRRSGRLYPEVRAIFEFIADRGELTAWYRAYVETAAEDPSGAAALEHVFAQPIDAIEDDFRTWLAARAEVDHSIDPGDAALGIEARPHAASDGVTIGRVWPGSSARRAGLRVNDVIVAIDGEPTRTLRELQRCIAQKRVGDRVIVRYRRDGRYDTTPMTLRALGR